MLTRLLPILGACLFGLLAGVAQAGADARLTILSYHEIAERQDALVPAYAVTPTNFVRQLDWLKNNGYHFVSVDAVLADRAGKAPLPDKAVLLTFDDGYRSVYSHAFPILKLFKAPAVVSLVGSWLAEPDRVSFDGRVVPRSVFLAREELREMVDSGLVEAASHSYALHEGILANPQGNKEPAATSRRYLADEPRYEDETRYRRRILADLKQNNAVLRQYTGQTPRVMVWPYGRYNSTTRDVAAQLGLTLGLTLDDGANTAETPLAGLRRILVEAGMSLWDLDREIALRAADVSDRDRPAKIMHVDLDNIYDPDPAEQENNLGRLLDRIVAMGVNTVYLQAFADPDGNGAADALYFPNRHLPMRADLFNRVAWQIRTRTPVKRLYAWMPVLAFELPASHPAAVDKVVTQATATDHLVMGYPRLSPFSPRARQTIRDIYEDLARSAPFEGLLFHDDVTLSDYEDASAFALQAYQQWGLPGALADIRASDDLLGRWTILKINALDSFAMELAAIVRAEQPMLKTARNLYARVALNPRAEVWYSQSLDNSLSHYDFTAIMAMPYMEQAADPAAFLRELVAKVAEKPGALNKVVFELQATDWRQQRLIPNQELAETIRAVYAQGGRHVGYYPDNVHQDHPDPAALRPVLDSKPNAPELP